MTRNALYALSVDIFLIFEFNFRQSNLHYTNSQTNATANYMLTGEQPNLNQINYHQEEPEDSHPPPMIPIRQFLANGGVLSPTFIRQQQQQQQARMAMDAANQNSSRLVTIH